MKQQGVERTSSLPGFTIEYQLENTKLTYSPKEKSIYSMKITPAFSKNCEGCKRFCDPCYSCIIENGTKKCSHLCTSCWSCDCAPVHYLLP